MECDRILDLVPLYVGGDCTADEAALVERHVAACERCSAEVSAYRSSMQALKAGAGVELPAGIEAGLWDGVKRGLALRPARPAFALAGASRWLAAAAVFLFGLAATMWGVKALRPEAPEKPVAKGVSVRHPDLASVPVPGSARPGLPVSFDLRSVATPASARDSELDVIPASADRAYLLDELRVLKRSEVTLGY